MAGMDDVKGTVAHDNRLLPRARANDLNQLLKCLKLVSVVGFHRVCPFSLRINCQHGQQVAYLRSAASGGGTRWYSTCLYMSFCWAYCSSLVCSPHASLWVPLAQPQPTNGSG